MRILVMVAGGNMKVSSRNSEAKSVVMGDHFIFQLAKYYMLRNLVVLQTTFSSVGLKNGKKTPCVDILLLYQNPLLSLESHSDQPGP